LQATSPVPVAILVRVSTTKQETTRQITELRSHAEKSGWQVIAICEEVISGAADSNKRQGFARVLELARQGKIRKVLVHEVSRIARKNSIAHGFLEELTDLGVSLYWHSQNVETLLPSGKRNPAVGFMFSLLAEMAQAERETLRERILSGMAQARKEGRRIGRPRGTVLSRDQLLKKYPRVVRLLKEGHSVRNTASISGVSTNTVQKVRSTIGSLSPSKISPALTN